LANLTSCDESPLAYFRVWCTSANYNCAWRRLMWRHARVACNNGVVELDCIWWIKPNQTSSMC